jgi:predicted aspartyl protease
MSKNKPLLHPKTWLVGLFAVIIFCGVAIGLERPGWRRQEVDWRMSGGSRIKAIHYPEEKPPPLLSKRDGRRPTAPRKKILPAEAASRLAPFAQEPTAPLIATVIDSPPIDGFVPWTAVSVTDAHDEPYALDAIPETSVTGSYLTPDPQSDYALGIFDTGASTSIMNAFEAYLVGLYDASLVTSSTVELIGATGSVFAWVSQPLGLFIDGLGAIDPNSLLVDDSNMVGESNVSILVGDPIDSPNLPTVIGSPWAVFFAAAFHNDQQITLTYDGNEITAPDIHFYPLSDPGIPNYSNKIYLELRPSPVLFVQYFPCIEPLWECPEGDGSPLYPTLIVDGMWLYQGLFFVYSVDVAHGNKSAIDKDGFMFDTGAQVTVISEAIGARLQLHPAHPDFEAEIQGVTGDIITAPGFYIDSLEITATPEWLSFTNIPVVMLDVDSPEGGFFDGIIGMNLFVDLNFVFHGGGLTLLGQDPPFIRFDPIPPCQITGDIVPEGGDCKVDYLDLAEFVNHWLETSTSPNWNPECDMAPQPTPDEKADFLDFAILAEHWLEDTAP